jgi:lipopolysaccharide/colanic/teichoic acid biosynthesis glycosyltransferase
MKGSPTMALKRLADILIAATAIAALSPVMLFTALLVRLRLGSPVIFTQPRAGRNNETFVVYKFRSMLEPSPLSPATDTERLTPFGRWLRSTSLDELPQLFCVIKGDMSLVGPRPLLPQYTELYSAEQRRRLLVRPGITGLSQVRGRNAAPWDDRLRWDVEYVDSWSLRLDVRILLLTVKVVFRGSGVSAPGEATVTEFAGSALPSR